MMPRGLVLVLVLSAALAQADSLDLLSEPGAWQANLDRGATTMALAPTADAKLAVTVNSDGSPESYPKLRYSWKAGEDLSRFLRLETRLRITSESPAVRSKRIAFVFYDAKTLREDLPDKPMTQQSIEHTVPVNRWVDYSDWLLAVRRTAIRQLDLYIYEEPPATAHPYRWEFARLEFAGVGEQALLFDTEIYDKGSFQAPGTASPAAGSIRSADGLAVTLDRTGVVTAIEAAGAALGAPARQCSGLLVRDVTTKQPPVRVGGSVQPAGDRLRQTAVLEDLGLAVEATYASIGNAIEIAGSVTDRRGADRAVTVYLALPLATAPWQWWDNVAGQRSQPEPFTELTTLETGMHYGLHGAHSKYPLGAVSWPDHGGLTLAVRMDEPVVHRLGFNPELRLFYIALDFGLIPEKAADGRSLATAPFRVLLYRHDPAWGFRDALQRYYDLFPDFFVRRCQREGGWYVWGAMEKLPGALEAGFGFHWGPGGTEAVKWDNAHGIPALYYIEPETYQQTMEDVDRQPTTEELLARLQKLAQGDPAELATVAAQPYRVYPLGDAPDPLTKRIQTTAEVVTRSLNHGPDGQPYCSSGQYGWMQKSKWGSIFSCNVAPDIPNGKGQFNFQYVIGPALAAMEKAGGHYDGIGLDSFGGYGQLSRVNYRREHFGYSKLPLSFSAADHRPVQVGFFATVEWLRELARDMHGRKLILMANCSWGTTPGWLTFAAPYLDVFGAEAPLFADPDFARAIAFRKPCTDLPYNPRPDWEIGRHLVHGIYPGHGNQVEVMQRTAQLLRDLAAAGWEPVTRARVTPPALRLERYGQRGTLYLVVHNPAEAPVSATVTLDTAALGLGPIAVRNALSGEALPGTGPALTVALGARDTVALAVSAAK